MGDLLFVMANLARHLKIDPERTLRRANAKFTRRFRAIEAALAAEGRRPAQDGPSSDYDTVLPGSGASGLRSASTVTCRCAMPPPVSRASTPAVPVRLLPPTSSCLVQRGRQDFGFGRTKTVGST